MVSIRRLLLLSVFLFAEPSLVQPQSPSVLGSTNSTSSTPTPAESAASASPLASPTSSSNDSGGSASPSPTTAKIPASTPSSSPSSPSSSTTTNNSSSSGATNKTQSTSNPSNSNSSSNPQSVVVLTVTRTNADGSLVTTISSGTPMSEPSSAVKAPPSSSSSSSSTWPIIGGVVGGLVVLGSVVFVVFRCTQRRFSDLDDEDVAIKWPELVTRADDPSTLNPLAARPGVGHGVGEDEEPENEKSRHYASDLTSEPSHRSTGLTMFDHSYPAYMANPGYGTGEPNGYYDPYLGPSAVPQPFPPTLTSDYAEPGYAQGGYLPSAVQGADGSHPDGGSRHSTQQGVLDRGPSYRSTWESNEVIPLTVVNSSHNNGNGPHRSPSAAS